MIVNEEKTIEFFSKSQTSDTLCDINRIFSMKKAREPTHQCSEQCVVCSYIILVFKDAAYEKNNDMLDHKMSTHRQCLHNILSLIRPLYAPHRAEKTHPTNKPTNQPSK